MKRHFLVLLGLAAVLPAAAGAQQGRPISLDEALRLAESQSEAVRIAQAGVLRARGQKMQTSSLYRPQVGLSVAYTRALASQFEALAEDAPVPPPGTPPIPPNDGTQYFPPCNRYLAPAGATDPQRLAGLETYAKCSSTGGFIDFSKVGFGSENQWNFGVQGTWDVFTGGRTLAQNRAADAARTAADIELVSQRARLTLDITEAYFDAVLADRLVAIADSSLALSENVLGQTRLARQVGNQSEFDLLRAQVTRDNQMPALLQRRTDRDLAYARLKQMLNVPGNQQITLTTGLGNEQDLLQLVRTTSGAVPTMAEGDTSSITRAPVRQLGENLRAQQEQLNIAKRAWLPTVTLSSQYGRLSFPASGVPDFNNLLTNWTVSVTATMPLYTGGRLRGQSMVAEAGVREAEARYEQVREAASLDAQQAIAMLQQAQAALAASQGTTGQASKAYSIAEVRYREGLSTQVELNDSRLLLQQAAANSALAVRNVQVARMRLALLRDLPLGAGVITIPLSPGAPAGVIAPQFIAPQGPAAAPAGTTRAASTTVIVP
jgi:outer membrane protein TolC